jgi:hypothetical protein
VLADAANRHLNVVQGVQLSSTYSAAFREDSFEFKAVDFQPTMFRDSVCYADSTPLNDPSGLKTSPAKLGRGRSAFDSDTPPGSPVGGDGARDDDPVTLPEAGTLLRHPMCAFSHLLSAAAVAAMPAMSGSHGLSTLRPRTSVPPRGQRAQSQRLPMAPSGLSLTPSNAHSRSAGVGVASSSGSGSVTPAAGAVGSTAGGATGGAAGSGGGGVGGGGGGGGAGGVSVNAPTASLRPRTAAAAPGRDAAVSGARAVPLTVAGVLASPRERIFGLEWGIQRVYSYTAAAVRGALDVGTAADAGPDAAGGPGVTASVGAAPRHKRMSSATSSTSRVPSMDGGVQLPWLGGSQSWWHSALAVAEGLFMLAMVHTEARVAHVSSAGAEPTRRASAVPMPMIRQVLTPVDGFPGGGGSKGRLEGRFAESDERDGDDSFESHDDTATEALESDGDAYSPDTTQLSALHRHRKLSMASSSGRDSLGSNASLASRSAAGGGGGGGSAGAVAFSRAVAESALVDCVYLLTSLPQWWVNPGAAPASRGGGFTPAVDGDDGSRTDGVRVPNMLTTELGASVLQVLEGVFAANHKDVFAALALEACVQMLTLRAQRDAVVVSVSQRVVGERERERADSGAVPDRGSQPFLFVRFDTGRSRGHSMHGDADGVGVDGGVGGSARAGAGAGAGAGGHGPGIVHSPSGVTAAGASGGAAAGDCFCRFVHADIALTCSPLLMGRFHRQISRNCRRLAVLCRRVGLVYRAIKYYHHTLLLSMALRQMSEALFLAETASALMLEAGDARAAAQVLVQVVRFLCNRDDGVPRCASSSDNLVFVGSHGRAAGGGVGGGGVGGGGVGGSVVGVDMSESMVDVTHPGGSFREPGTLSPPSMRSHRPSVVTTTGADTPVAVTTSTKRKAAEVEKRLRRRKQLAGMPLQVIQDWGGEDAAAGAGVAAAAVAAGRPDADAAGKPRAWRRNPSKAAVVAQPAAFQLLDQVLGPGSVDIVKGHDVTRGLSVVDVRRLLIRLASVGVSCGAITPAVALLSPMLPRNLQALRPELFKYQIRDVRGVDVLAAVVAMSTPPCARA